MFGELLFLRYAFPCADGKLLAGKISKDEYDQLKKYAEGGGRPPRRLLKHCFYPAFCSLREYAQDSEIWNFDTVAAYWREHHGHEGECRVRKATVKSVSQNGAVFLFEETGLFINFYKLELAEGDTVYIHRRVIVEKAVSE